MLGENDLNDEPDCNFAECAAPVQRRRPVKKIIHENYDRHNIASQYDLALIRMDDMVVLSNGNLSVSAVTPICLPWKPDHHWTPQLQENNMLTLTGWGNRSTPTLGENCDEFRPATGILQRVEVPYKTMDVCNRETHFKDLDPTSQICTGSLEDETQDSCNGQAGSPLVTRKVTDLPWFQVGVQSYGTANCDKGSSNIYTRVSEFLPWIERHLEP